VNLGGASAPMPQPRSAPALNNLSEKATTFGPAVKILHYREDKTRCKRDRGE